MAGPARPSAGRLRQRCWTNSDTPIIFGQFHPSRQDRWVFGDRDSGIHLIRAAWTKIVRHRMVAGTSSPDDPALIEYSWAQRRRKQARYRWKASPRDCCRRRPDVAHAARTRCSTPTCRKVHNSGTGAVAACRPASDQERTHRAPRAARPNGRRHPSGTRPLPATPAPAWPRTRNDLRARAVCLSRDAGNARPSGSEGACDVKSRVLSKSHRLEA